MADPNDPTEPLPFMPIKMVVLEAQLEKRAKRKASFLMQGLKFILAMLLLAGLALGLVVYIFLAAVFLIGFSLPFLAIPLVEWRRDRVDFANSLKALTEWEDPRAVGLLCLAYLHAGNRERDAHRSRLIRSLPLLTERDSEHFTFIQRNALHSLLDEGNHALTIAALTGLAQVGNKSTLPFLKSLSTQNETYLHELIKAAIETCQNAITSRLERDSLSEILLRPSHETHAGAEVLLRPSRETETDETQLLRPKE